MAKYKDESIEQQPSGRLTPREFAFATPQDLGGVADYRQFCESVGLEPIAEGWGFLHCEDEKGHHVTLLTPDVEYQRMLISAPASLRVGLQVPAGKYPLRRNGWPDEWWMQPLVR